MARWHAVITDRRVLTKIMLAVGVIAAFSLFDGLYALSSVGAVNDQVKRVYQHNLELETIGDLRAAVNRTWLAADDYLLATDAAGRTAAGQSLDKAETDVQTAITTFTGYPDLPADSETNLATFQTGWTSFRALLTDRLLPLADAGNTTEIATVRTGELETSKTAVRATLNALVDETVTASSEQEAAAEEVYGETKVWVTTILLLSTALGLAFAAVVARLIVAPLSRAVGALDRISGGDLTARVTVTGKDEIGRLSGTLNRTADAMAGMVRQVGENSEMLASASEQLTAVASELSRSAEATSTQVGTVSDAANQVSQSVRAVASGADEMGISIREIANNAGEAATVAAEAAHTAQTTNAGVIKLGEASTEIGAVIALITAIAQQTNLLALNATIEAARAGEAGKGFAVVASEVKDLAQETAKATEQISAQVANIQSETQGTVEAIGNIAAVIATINDYTTTIASAVEEQTATTGEMARSVSEAADGSSRIADTISGVAAAADSVTGGAADTRQTAAELARMAAELRRTVSAYQV
ncbi:methyl-accepting chemotaxis protein [Catenuloplanes sp. NPDC051500]|uniref:methyl-accepting chemotaxis protein n=1 Tax=Catenuloplanes sp. NPDC051500 TaxID=3363959 RepID=UPI0037A5466D